MKKFLLLLQVAGILLVGIPLSGCSKPEASARKPKIYQCPMHPWITSDKPGSCTICGMQLVASYDDKPPADSATLLSISPDTARVIGLETAVASLEPLGKSIRFSGILDDDDTLHRVVAAFYDGRIEQVFVQQVGQKVKAGQPLASIYSPELLYVVREYQNAAARGKNDPVALNSRHRLVQYGLSPGQVDALATAPRDRYALDILAPMDGTILVRNAYQGQYVKNGERLFEMGNLARLWFKAEVYEKDLSFVRIGEKARITSPAAPGRTFEGTVTFLDPNFDPDSRSTKIRIEVDNPLTETPGSYERILPHRAYAEAELQAFFPAVLSIPRTALIRDGRREVVYIQKNPGEFEMRPVKAGLTGDSRVQIVSGLVDGDIVAARGNLMLDAEAQLRSGGQDAGNSKKALPESLVRFFQRLSAISSALASDDLTAAQKEVPWKFESGAPASESTGILSMAESRLAGLPKLEQSGNLVDFRKAFYVWSTAAAELALELKAAGYAVPVRVFECPMTGASFPGAPKSARWIQVSDKTDNPYLGLDMQNCGKEVAQ